MAKNFGPGILGGIVRIDPATGLPYKATGGGGGGGADWGDIGGTLSNQTDLNNALGGKANSEDVVPRSQTLTDPTNDLVARFEIQSDGSSTSGWSNRWEWLYKAVGWGAAKLVGWINEYGELRGMPALSNTVAARWFVAANSTDLAARSMSVPVVEVADKRDGERTTLVGIYGNGDMGVKGLLIDGRRLTIGPVEPASPNPGDVHILTED